MIVHALFDRYTQGFKIFHFQYKPSFMGYKTHLENITSVHT
jgi:hypothetical protein